MKKKHSKTFLNSGFTIVEVLTVAIILATIGGILTGIISSLLRGSNKTQTTSVLAQNGSYTISLITGIINTSDRVTKVNDDTDIQAYCTSDPSEVTSISLRRFDGEETTLLCDLDNKRISSVSATLDSISLTNNLEVELDTEAAQACYFKCTQPNNDIYVSPLIEVGFTLKNNKEGLAEFQSSGLFKNSILLKNYNQD